MDKLTRSNPNVWIKSGCWSYRRWWGIGPLQIIMEEKRLVYRPRYTGHTMANWTIEVRWRRATRDELNEIKINYDKLYHRGMADNLLE